MSVLDKIIKDKIEEIAKFSSSISLASLKLVAQEKGVISKFIRSLSEITSTPKIIAEVKFASPSKGIIRSDLKAVEIAKAYCAGGATCLSILTDQKYFQGNLDYLREVRAELPNMPLLRKDFIIDAYQVWESKAAGADALLLIVAGLEKNVLAALLTESSLAKIDVLLEVHNFEELRQAFEVISELNMFNPENDSFPIIFGINNRDLKSFTIDIGITADILKKLDSLIEDFKLSEKRELLKFVSESGIFSATDISKLKQAGADAFLIGESLMKEGNPGENLQNLISDYTKLVAKNV
jgi:indole-3-glycerol phosphate synthase